QVEAGAEPDVRFPRGVSRFVLITRAVPDAEETGEGVLEPVGLGRQDIPPSAHCRILISPFESPLDFRGIGGDRAVLNRFVAVAIIIEGEGLADELIMQVLRREDVLNLLLVVCFQYRHYGAD